VYKCYKSKSHLVDWFFEVVFFILNTLGDRVFMAIKVPSNPFTTKAIS